MKYLVVYEQTEQNFGAYLPDLPGCIATGRTREEVQRNIHEAIAFHIEGLKANNMEPTPPTAFAGYEDIPE